MASEVELAEALVPPMADAAGAELASLQAARQPLATRRADEKMRVLQPDASAELLLRASQRAATVVQRIVWLHKAATAWGRPIEAVAACRKGCAHCCHIPVTLSSKEAELISRATGRAALAPRYSVRVQDLTDVETVTAASAQLQHWETGTACPFLVDAACAIYASRPLACRVLFNLDDDDLLCRHGAADASDVPYADSRMMRALALAAQPAETLADIRDFFPPGDGPQVGR